MKRGDLVLVAGQREFGKPRPGLVLQADSTFPSEYITYIPITSDLLRVPGVRVPIEPSTRNGLRVSSEIMINLMQTASLSRFGGVIGTVEEHILGLVVRALSLHLGLDED